MAITTSTFATRFHLDNSVYYLSYTATSACLLSDTTHPPLTLVCPLLLLTTHQLPIVHSIPTHSTSIWSSYCLCSSAILPTLPSHTYLIQTSPAISTCTADYLPASNSIFSVLISLLFQHHPTRHVSHPTISYCDHPPWPSPTSNIRYDSSLSSAYSVLFKEHTFIYIYIGM